MNLLTNQMSRCELAALLALSQSSLQCRTKDQMKDLVLGLKKMIGFENACCAQANLPDRFLDRDPELDFLDISYPHSFLEIYWEKRYHLIDPVLCTALTLLSPVTFQMVEKHTGCSETISLGRDFGMGEGWAHCIVDPGSWRCTVFFMRGPKLETSLRAQRIIEHIIPFFSLAFTRVNKKHSQTLNPLTSRELEVLNWIKEGKSSWEISLILNCSKRVVDFHVNNIKAKLNALSRAQCVAIAADRSIINL
jgi:LuxR family transcriptional regulator, quorum-sensing system regulator CviR